MFFNKFFLDATEAVTETLTAVEEVLGTAVETGVAETAETLFKFYPQGFVEQLGHMGLGMLAIFVVIGVIIGMVYALDVVVKAFSVKIPKK